MRYSRSQKGFTLIEIMVVVVIIATISGFSVLALTQANQRRYFSQADDLHSWLQQLSELAMLEGTAYGFKNEDNTLQSMVFYRQRWHRAALPDTFTLFENAVFEKIEINDGEAVYRTDEDNEDVFPDVVMLADGYIDAGSILSLQYEEQEPVFSYYWDDEKSAVVMENVLALSLTQ